MCSRHLRIHTLPNAPRESPQDGTGSCSLVQELNLNTGRRWSPGLFILLNFVWPGVLRPWIPQEGSNQDFHEIMYLPWSKPISGATFFKDLFCQLSESFVHYNISSLYGWHPSHPMALKFNACNFRKSMSRFGDKLHEWCSSSETDFIYSSGWTTRRTLKASTYLYKTLAYSFIWLYQEFLLGKLIISIGSKLLKENISDGGIETLKPEKEESATVNWEIKHCLK